MAKLIFDFTEISNQQCIKWSFVLFCSAILANNIGFFFKGENGYPINMVVFAEYHDVSVAAGFAGRTSDLEFI